MAKTVNAKRIMFILNNEEYRMDRYSTTKIYIYKNVDGVFDFVPAKEVIRQKLEELNQVINNNNNTRQLGTQLYKLLEEK